MGNKGSSSGGGRRGGIGRTLMPSWWHRLQEQIAREKRNCNADRNWIYNARPNGYFSASPRCRGHKIYSRKSWHRGKNVDSHPHIRRRVDHFTNINQEGFRSYGGRPGWSTRSRCMHKYGSRTKRYGRGSYRIHHPYTGCPSWRGGPNRHFDNYSWHNRDPVRLNLLERYEMPQEWNPDGKGASGCGGGRSHPECSTNKIVVCKTTGEANFEWARREILKEKWNNAQQKLDKLNTTDPGISSWGAKNFYNLQNQARRSLETLINFPTTTCNVNFSTRAEVPIDGATGEKNVPMGSLTESTLNKDDLGQEDYSSYNFTTWVMEDIIILLIQ